MKFQQIQILKLYLYLHQLLSLLVSTILVTIINKKKEIYLQKTPMMKKYSVYIQMEMNLMEIMKMDYIMDLEF